MAQGALPTTGLCAPGGWMGYPRQHTCWGRQAIILKTWPQTIVMHRGGKNATFLAVKDLIGVWGSVPLQEGKLPEPLPLFQWQFKVALLFLCPIQFLISSSLHVHLIIHLFEILFPCVKHQQSINIDMINIKLSFYWINKNYSSRILYDNIF